MGQETEVQDPEISEAEGTPVENEGPEATPEEQDDEVAIPKEADKQEKPKPEAKKPYTSEELEELITSDGQVDSERLTAEGKLLLKSFQRGYGKKFDTLAEERRKLQETKPPTALTPKETYFQEYLADPIGKVQEINAEIQAAKARMRGLRANGEYEKADAEDEKATALENLREEFAVRETTLEKQKGKWVEFNAAVLQAVPDIDTKVDLLVRFAKEELGFTETELYRMTNPESGVPVATAVKHITNIDRQYRQANAAKTVSKKVKKPAPPVLERGGAGGNNSDTRTQKSKSLEEIFYPSSEKE